jgi:purine nucleoside phosphorylase
MTKAVLGIIGGSGIYDLPGLTNAQTKSIASPWGKPSGALLTGEIGGLPIVFLPRHDKGHRLSPSDINYRANIDVLKRAGVTDLVSLSACGSFKAELGPGTFVLIDQFVDRTHARASSSSAPAASRMSRWRIRCRQGCAFIWPKRRAPKASMSCATALMSAWRGRNSRRWPKA